MKMMSTPPSSSRLLLLYVTDAYKLSTLLLRHTLLTRPRPTTFTALGDTVRKILLDQSRPSTLTNKGSSLDSSCGTNVVAVKLLHWHRELNLVKYHGVHDYFKQLWWSSTKTTQGSNNNKSDEMRINTSAAKVSLMITSEQRYKLSTILGYTTEDIRTFKPHEAHLLLQHGIHKYNNDGSSDDDVGMGDFRTRLNALLIKEEEKENKQSTSHTDLQGTKFNHVVNNSASGEQHNDERMTISSRPSMNDDNDTMMSSTSLAVLPEQTDDALDRPSHHLQHPNHNVDATIPIIEEQFVREERNYSRVLRTDVISHDVDLDNMNRTCWYEVIEKSPKIDDEYEEQVVALFRTEKEAQECVKIKTTIHLSRSSKAEGKNACLDDERYLVRKRGDI